MKKGNLFSTIAFIFSIMLLIVSGAIYVYSAQQQSVSSSLSVTFSGDQASFSAEAYYQVQNSETKVSLKDSSDNTHQRTILSFSATDAPTTKTLELYNPNTIELTASDQYVLFTYKFTNTASDGAYDIKVSLTGTSNEDANLDVKYYTSNSDYNTNALNTQKNTVLASSETEFTNVYIPSNNGVKYFYILVKVKDNTIGATFNKSNVNWTITGTQHKSNAVVSFASNSMSVDTSTNAINTTIQGPALTNTGDGTVTYTSSNTSVATVDSNGIVTIKGPGTARITATASSGTNSSYTTNSAYYDLTVSGPTCAVTTTMHNRQGLGAYRDYFSVTLSNNSTNEIYGTVTHSDGVKEIDVPQGITLKISFTRSNQGYDATANIGGTSYDINSNCAKTIEIGSMSTLSIFYDYNAGLCCVSADTMIAMADGTEKRADEIVVGDRVLSYNELTGEIEEDIIDYADVRYRDNQVTITFTDGTYIKITNDHPLLTMLGWKCYDLEAGEYTYGQDVDIQGEFVVGDKILTLKGVLGAYFAEFDKTISNIEIEYATDELYETYAFFVRNNHNYIGNKVLSHNCLE